MNLPLIRTRIACLMFLSFTVCFPAVHAKDAGPMAITKDHKCPTCGMRVAGFTNWHTQIVYPDHTNQAFCAVKCLMAYYFEPSRFSDAHNPGDSKTLFAKDYYTQAWHNMDKMVFVMGSDVMGPMGKDLVPFADKKAAETFLADHNGEAILQFDEITPELIQKLRHKKGKGL